MEAKVVGFEHLSPTHQGMLRDFLREELMKCSCDMKNWGDTPDNNPAKVEMVGWLAALRGLYESTVR
jgi:hypothetical protein